MDRIAHWPSEQASTAARFPFVRPLRSLPPSLTRVLVCTCLRACMRVRLRVCACVCLCVCVHACVRASLCRSVRVLARRACECACLRECVSECVRAQTTSRLESVRSLNSTVKNAFGAVVDIDRDKECVNYGYDPLILQGQVFKRRKERTKERNPPGTGI